MTAYAAAVITVNTEAKGFTFSKIIPEDAATKGVAIEALVSVEDHYFHVVTRGRPHGLWAPFSGGVRRRCPLAGV